MKPVFIIVIVAVTLIVIMTPSIFAESISVNCDMLNPNSILVNCDLTKINFKDLDLSGSDLSGSNLSDVNLTSMNLSQINFSGANLKRTDLSGSNLMNANFDNAKLGSNFSGASLINANFDNADLSGSNLMNADLSGASLMNADLSGMNLRFTNFSGSNLMNADLSGASLMNANFDNANIQNTNFDGVRNTSYTIGLKNILLNEINYNNQKSSEEKGGGCLIATATYGSELSSQVQYLRELRDNQLLQTESGTQFMEIFNDIYYSFSPKIADYERENPYFKEAVNIAITPMITSLSLMENVNSESEVLSIGISVIILNLGMYLAVPSIVIVGIRKIK